LWWPKKSCEDRESPLQTPLFSKEIIDLPDQTTILLHRGKLSERLNEITANPGFYMSRFFKYLSWSFFFLMPLLGFFLWLVFKESEPYYVSHFIFAINQHIVLFFLLIIIMLINLILPDKKSSAENYLMALIPLYAYVGAWQLYRRRWFSVFFRLLLATSLYLFFYLIITGAVAFFALLL
jgi:hypothetical protein